MEVSPSPGSNWYRLELPHFWGGTVARGSVLSPCPSHGSPRTGAFGCSRLGRIARAKGGVVACIPTDCRPSGCSRVGGDRFWLDSHLDHWITLGYKDPHPG